MEAVAVFVDDDQARAGVRGGHRELAAGAAVDRVVEQDNDFIGFGKAARRHQDLAGVDRNQSVDLRSTKSAVEGGVDECAAGLDKVHELVSRLVFVGVTTPGHRAEPQA